MDVYWRNVCKLHKLPYFKFDSKKLELYCEDCESGVEFNEVDLKKSLKEKIIKYLTKERKTHGNQKKTLKERFCPERRKSFIVQNSLPGLIISLKFLKNYKHQKFVCENCSSNDSTVINVTNFNHLCETCSVQLKIDSSYLHNLSSILENQQYLSHALLETIKRIPSNYINKYHLLFSKHHEIKDPYIHFYEIKFLLEQDEVKVLRCVNCVKTLSFGRYSPITLQCNHSICYDCYFSVFYEKCPLDDTDFNDARKVLVDLNPYELYCHNKHSLINYEKKIFKLPCLHNSCDDCMHLKICGTCGLNFSDKKIKTNEKLIWIIEFLTVFCSFHPRNIANRFEYFNNLAYCKSCNSETTKASGNRLIVSNLENAVICIYQQIEGIRENYKKKLSLFQLKCLLFTRIIKLNTLQKFLMTFFVSENTISLLPVVRIKRFEKIYRSYDELNIYQGWKMQEGNFTGFYISFHNDSLVNGIIFGGLVPKKILCDSKVKNYHRNLSIKITNSKGNELISCIQDVQAGEKELTVNFIYPVMMKQHKKYKILLEINANLYYGLPFFSYKIKEFDIEPIEMSPNLIGKNVISGPILGFLVSTPPNE